MNDLLNDLDCIIKKIKPKTMKDLLNEYIEKYKNDFDDEIVDRAVKYIDDMVMFSTIPLKKKSKEDMDPDVLDGLRLDILRAYMDAVYSTMCIGLEKIRKNSLAKGYKKFRKEKDFCVAFNFGDNDFGADIEEAANMYADSYNYKLGCIDHYTDKEFEQIKDKSLYVKDINAMEGLDFIKNILKTGFRASYVKDNCTRQIDVEVINPDNLFEHAKKLTEYLNFDDDTRWYIGTVDDVQDKIMEEFKSHVSNPETTNISNIWLNGECLFMAVIDGEMKVWIR